jgi:AcrR family transcriptional regulator
MTSSSPSVRLPSIFRATAYSLYVTQITDCMKTAQRAPIPTRRALLDAARHLFATKGYFNTGTEELVAAAGVGTRGALYHHFDSKQAIFRAVFIEVLEDYNARPVVPAPEEAPPLERLRVGLRNFLATTAEPEVQRIILIDAPSILGWDELRELQRLTIVARLRELIDAAIESGDMRNVPPDAITRLIIAAVQEAGLLIVRADAARSREVLEAIDALVDGLRGP